MLQAEQKNHRFLELDSLRGLAAFAVVMAHFREATSQVSHLVFVPIAHLLGGGPAAVDLFFLLSGFVLTIPFLGKRPPTYGAYVIKRVCRVYLPYVAAILIAAALAARLYSTVPTGNHWIDQTWSLPFSPRLLMQHLVMLGQFDNTRLNTAIWSLKIEMRVSLIFPLIVMLVQRVPAKVLLASCVPATIALAILRDGLGLEFIVNTFFCALMFLVGSLLSLNYRRVQGWLETFGAPALAGFFLAGFALYQIGDQIPLPHTGWLASLGSYGTTCVITLGAVALLMVSTVWKSLRHVLHNPVLQWAGTRSYSIYLLHATVLFTFIRLAHGVVLPLSMFLPYVAVTFLISEIFHRTVELPTLLLGRKLSASRTKETSAAPLHPVRSTAHNPIASR